jgi:hypothetical protein
VLSVGISGIELIEVSRESARVPLERARGRVGTSFAICWVAATSLLGRTSLPRGPDRGGVWRCPVQASWNSHNDAHRGSRCRQAKSDISNTAAMVKSGPEESCRVCHATQAHLRNPKEKRRMLGLGHWLFVWSRLLEDHADLSSMSRQFNMRILSRSVR